MSSRSHLEISGLLVGLATFSALLTGVGRVHPADPAGLAFFEKKIRPILSEHCYTCHSSQAKKLRGGLRLDSRSGMLKGGDSGPAVVRGNPSASTLLKALRQDGDLKMPPKGKLPGGVIADFETWIRQGAPAPTDDRAVKSQAIDLLAGRKFWAYQPPRKPALPAIKDAAWAQSDIDRFVLARLERQGLRPAPDAGAATLVRRAYFDLIGLPPSPEQIDAFAGDPSPNAYEKLVDRLLASPQFGERWGRHWLDVARFAESLTLRGFVLPETWRYRDYVIDAFNADLPFEQFVREQVAGDLLPAADLAQRRRQLTAVAFLALGNTNLEEQDKKQLVMDVVDEQLDTISKAFLGQTIGCARCHDHKFDPIPTRDYYALAGILRNTRTLEHANVSKWLEAPLPAPPDQEAVLRKHEGAVAELQARQQALRKVAGGRGKSRGPVAVADLPGIVVDDVKARKVGEWKNSQFAGFYVGAGYVHDLDSGKGQKTITFHPELAMAGKYEVRLAYSPGSNRSRDVPVTIFSADGEKTVHVDEQQPPPIDGLFVSLGQYHFERNGQGYVLITNEGTRGHIIADAVQFLPVELLHSTRDAPDPDRAELKKLEAELKRLQDAGPKRERVLTVFEEKEISDAPIHIRGSVHRLGEIAARGFLRVASAGPAPPMPANESGRRQLADWLADRHNPLTARVFVNRAWHWLFGAGLVRTPDNFGTTGEAPSHPDLLDHLATQFIDDGWSIKMLVRRIVLSRTYQLATTASESSLAADPENRLFGRANRRRLEAECLGDAMLAVAGRLRLDMGGPNFPAGLASDYGFQHSGSRRSVYFPVFRNALPEVFELFDFADPSTVTGRRSVSTVAPQGLFFLNHPLVLQQADAAAARLLAELLSNDAARITRAYRRSLGRPPSPSEQQLALRFVAAGPERDLRKTWALLFHALFASLDFRYVN